MKAPKQRKTHKIENRCIQCGKPVPGRNQYCPDCYPDRKAEINTVLSTAGITCLKDLREQGSSPAHGGEAGRKRGESNRARSIARKEWEEANPGRLEEEKERFAREIQPLLQALTITEISRACGCSPRYASLMKKGEYVPHPALYHELEKAIRERAV